MTRATRLLIATFMVLATTGSCLALRGVIEQKIIMPDAINLNFGSTELDLVAAPHDATVAPPINVVARMNPGFSSWATGSSVVDAQTQGEAQAEVAVTENLGRLKTGNDDQGKGMQSSASLAGTLDVDRISVVFTPHDNTMGEVKLEVIQKSYFKLTSKYDSGGTDDQTKFFYWRLTFTDIDGVINESTFQWLQTTASASSTGAGASLKINGQAAANASWSNTVDQGVARFEYISESRWERKREIVLAANATGQVQTEVMTVDAGFKWDLHTTDDNSAELVQETSKLNGSVEFYTVIGFGKITITKNTDGTPANKTWHRGTDTGNPELLNDRVVLPLVTYVVP